MGYDITTVPCYQYLSFSCPNPARAPVSRSHASYQGETRAEASSLRAVNIHLKKKKHRLLFRQINPRAIVSRVYVAVNLLAIVLD